MLVLLCSALALAGALAVIATAGSGHSVASVGSRPQVTATAPEPPSSDDRPGRPADQATRGIRVDARVLPQRDEGRRPIAVEIPRMDVSAEVLGIGLDARRWVEVPEDVTRTGWYRYSQLPGAETGATVIVGHRDGNGQGPGALKVLDQLRLDDRIVVTAVDGTRWEYRVVARESFAKTVVPLDELFSPLGPHRLTLITCGGPFDDNSLGYTDNVVVTAVPIEAGRSE